MAALGDDPGGVVMSGGKMRKYSAGLIVLIAGAFLAVSAPVGFSQSLTDTLISAYRNSDLLKAQRAALRGTDEGVAQARAGFRPSINATASIGVTNFLSSGRTTRSASLALSLQLMLWDGGATELATKVAKMSVSVARRSLVDTEQQVLLAAVTAYMDMRRDAQFLQLAENNRAVLVRQVKATKDRYEVGEVRRTDVSQVEASLALAQSTVALRQGNLEISREAYHLATGRYPGVLGNPPPTPRIPPSLRAARAIALRSHPSIARAKDLAAMAELNVYRAEAAMKPKITFGGNIGINANSPSGDTVALAITGSVPIYQGGRLTSAHRQAIALEEKAKADIHRAGQLVSQTVTRFWTRLGIARATITARQKEVRASRVALQGIREEASLGARTTLDILDAESTLVRAQTNLAASKRDEYVAVYSLLSSMGLLTVKHLGLGIKTYDTTIHYKKVSDAPGPTNRQKLLEKIFKRAGKK